MTRDAPLQTIRDYYDGCSAGDVELMVGTLADDVVHYFLAPNPGTTPVAGAEHLARYWRKVTGMIDATWIVDHIVVDGDEAVIEWTMTWVPRGSSERIATRGSEWFVLRDGLISEIRSYYQQHQKSTELDGFPYAARGYSTLPSPWSDVHQPLTGGTP